MTPRKLMHDIECEIDNLLKNRAIMFDWMDREPGNTQMYRSLNSKISFNTKKLNELRKKWRDVREKITR